MQLLVAFPVPYLVAFPVTSDNGPFTCVTAADLVAFSVTSLVSVHLCHCCCSCRFFLSPLIMVRSPVSLLLILSLFLSPLIMVRSPVSLLLILSLFLSALLVRSPVSVLLFLSSFLSPNDNDELSLVFYYELSKGGVWGWKVFCIVN